ncbi:MAG: MBL fold metallo-hydrolase, partial [Planctomycetota bacterium]
PAAVGGDPEVIRTSASATIRGLKITGVDTDHDPSGGSERGHNVIFRVEIDGIALVHLGDLGHVLTPEQAEAIGPTDVALVPVGGFFTIDKDQAHEVIGQIRPKVVVPMHFKTPKVDFPIAGVEGFLTGAAKVKSIGSSSIEFGKADLPESLEIWVLDPAR